MEDIDEDLDFVQEVKKHMTKERAEFVRKLRVDEGKSWRSIVGECKDEWKVNLANSQLTGMALCYLAAKFFNEDSNKEPWN